VTWEMLHVEKEMRGKREEGEIKGRKEKTEKKSGIGKTNKSRLLDEKRELPCRTVHLYSCHSTYSMLLTKQIS
jgi:hypothetical protein